MQNGRPRFALADFGLARTYHVPHRARRGEGVKGVVSGGFMKWAAYGG